MEIIVDGNRDAAMTFAEGDMVEALTLANDSLRDQGRGIVSLRLDGEELSPEEFMDVLEARQASESATIEIESGDLRKMSLTMLEEMREILPELANACRALALIFQGDDPESGFEPFQELAEAWCTIKKREIMVMESLSIEDSAIDVGGGGMVELHAEFNAFLEEAAMAIENNDCVLLGDLLEYELAPRAETEIEIVECLARIVAERNES